MFLGHTLCPLLAVERASVPKRGDRMAGDHVADPPGLCFDEGNGMAHGGLSAAVLPAHTPARRTSLLFALPAVLSAALAPSVQPKSQEPVVGRTGRFCWG